jgi:hypothetical protein
MPGKMARSALRPPFGLPDAPVAVRTSLLSCRKAGKARIFTPVWDSSGESRFKVFANENPLDSSSERAALALIECNNCKNGHLSYACKPRPLMVWKCSPFPLTLL